MKTFLLSALGCALVAAGFAAQAERKPDQDAALDAVRRGRNLPLPVLERRVVPQVQGEYMRRFEYDEESNVYRMKFMRGGTVVWVDVDGRTGEIKGKSR